MLDLADEFTQQCRMRVGALLGDGVRLDALIGMGGMAAVYAATSPYGEPCAVKILHPDVAALGEARSRFLQEAEIAKSLAHPGIVKIEAVGTDGDDVFIVMELLIGETVDGRAERVGGRLPVDEVLWIADETLGVLAVAHAQGIVHRDLKPENLFLTKRNELKVLDFGIARAAELNAARSAAMTRTGIAMGTPAFMAPEQALGRWADVDGRTDLWALGATMFTLLTGQLVHEGETANEMIVSAATSPARSLARLLPDAPVELVRLVDHALSYDRQGRFESAAEMRRQLRAARPSTRPAAPVPGPSEPPRAPSAPPPERSARHMQAEVAATMPLGLASPPVPQVELPRAAPKATAPLGGRGGGGGGGSGDMLMLRGFERLDVSQVSVEERAQLRELFIAMDRAFVGRVQYGPEHAETKRRFERVTAAARGALENTREGLAWQVSPYSFHIEGENLWEPEAPHDRVPYALFSAGVRELALLRGIEGDEISELLRILTLDPVTEISPEDDVATLLWDACFRHVLVHAIDSFADGDQAARAAHERQIQTVVDEAQTDDRKLMEAAHRAEASGRGDGVEGLQRLASVAAGGGHELTADAVARAQDLVQRVTHRGAVEAGSRDVLPIEEATRKVLALRLSGDPKEVGERFVVAAARAVANADAKGAAEPLLSALAAAVEGLLDTAPAQALAFVAALCQALPGAAEKKEPLARRIATATLTEASMKRVLAVLAGSEGEEVAAAFAPVMPRLAGAHVDLVIDALTGASEGAARVVLLEYVRLYLAGHEATVADLFPKVDVDLGLALVRILADQGTAASKEAILRATESPHPVVRIEALGHVEGQSSERLRQEMRALLDDADKSVRVAALTAMAQHKIKAAGPFLAMRIKGATFDALDGEERRLALDTVAILTAARAEALAMELLEPGSVFKNEAREATRMIAAELLGRIASSDEAKQVLERVSGQRLLASKGVREAATQALKHLQERDNITKGTAS